ncbi:MAG: orotidine-5'-phosphate decarboxylase [Bdellovibrionales bacterium]|nr:orotidine-5'-phosphate decarboxylase [Bdellovibrionales bacterium]
MSKNTDLVVAMDYPTVAFAEALMEQLSGLPIVYKIGLELFLSSGTEWVRKQTEKGTRIFLDLKFHDIPNTVGQAVLQAARLGAEFTTVHLCGGKTMLDEIDIKLQEAILSGQIQKKPRVLGVTVLTSFKEEDWIAAMSHVAKVGSIRNVEESTMHFAALANDHPAIGGVVCSPQEINAIRSKHPKLYTMVPGIRPKGFKAHDQGRIMTPAEASASGASAIVVGRPITQAAEPRLVAEQILQEMV